MFVPEDKLNKLAMDYDPRPILAELSQQQQQAVGFDPGAQMQQVMQPGAGGMPQAPSPLNPQTMQMLMQGAQQPQQAVPQSPMPRGGINFQMQLPQVPTTPATPRPGSLHSIIGVRG